MKWAHTNEKLLNAARQAISESGPDDISLRSIARMAGVSPGAVYRHFPSKEALIERVVADGFASLESQLWRAIAKFPVGSLDRIYELGRLYVEFAREESAYYRLLFAPSPKPRPLESSPIQGLMRIVEECVRDCIRSGTLIDSDPKMITLLLWARLHGLITLFSAFDFAKEYPAIKRPNGLRVAIEATGLLLFQGLEKK